MAEEGHRHSHHLQRSQHGDHDEAAKPSMDPDAHIQSQSSTADELQKQSEELQKHKSREHLAQLAHIGAGAYTLYEHHERKKDPDHQKNHSWDTKVSTAVALGTGGYALYEHHEAHKIEHPKDKDEKHHGKHGEKHED